jgi:tRNA/rRNA methyltransferase
MADLGKIRIVLVETLYSGNIGSTCRAMANMGLNDLALVNPRCVDGWADADRLACHATEILQGRRTCATLAEAVGDCAAVVGATARLGLYRQHVRTPRDLAPDLLELTARDGRVALVFGREDKGLFNDEIGICTHLTRIPVAPAYASLNIAQAVLLCCYELYLACGSYEAPLEKSDLAPASQRIKLLEMWRAMLLRIGFMKDDKADHMMQGIQRVFARGAQTSDDVHILMGVARQADWAARTGGPGAAEAGQPVRPDSQNGSV